MLYKPTDKEVIQHAKDRFSLALIKDLKILSGLSLKESKDRIDACKRISPVKQTFTFDINKIIELFRPYFE